MATPVSMVHAVLPFREALLRDTYTHTCCHVNVVTFYSTLKENYSKLSFFFKLQWFFRYTM